MTAPPVLIVDGSRIHDIPSFHAEMNRVFMAGEDWQMGRSLDALNDVLHGGFGPRDYGEPLVLRWNGLERNRADLGFDATRDWLRARLEQPGFDHARLRNDLEALEAGRGQTFFDIVLEIIADHPEITLVAG